MSRWGLTDPPRAPFLFALDPKTEGDELGEAEREDLVQAVARTYVEQTALGLGLLKWADEDALGPTPRRGVRLADDQEKRLFTGAVITPFGMLDMDFERAKELSSLLPDPNLVRFVGLEQGLFEDYLRNRPLLPRKRQRIGDLVTVGQDGLAVAPISKVFDLGLETDGI